MNAALGSPPVYVETQRFSARLLSSVWAAMVLLSLALRTIAPAEDHGPVWLLPLTLLVVLALAWGVFVLRIEVHGDRLVVGLRPLPKLQLPLMRLRAIEVVDYRPVRDFGGWGLRIGRKGTIYSTSGSRAVRIEAEGRRPLFIGSAEPEALAAALRAARGRR
jgi:hypothetical protein